MFSSVTALRDAGKQAHRHARMQACTDERHEMIFWRGGSRKDDPLHATSALQRYWILSGHAKCSTWTMLVRYEFDTTPTVIRTICHELANEQILDPWEPKGSWEGRLGNPGPLGWAPRKTRDPMGGASRNLIVLRYLCMYVVCCVCAYMPSAMSI